MDMEKELSITIIDLQTENTEIKAELEKYKKGFEKAVYEYHILDIEFEAYEKQPVTIAGKTIELEEGDKIIVVRRNK